uniref:soluble epoxide hydrolase n=1 Tax=Kalanchoe fedtschenkoi TaxID=63787 RepID=A0A7N0TAG2_KALFE
MNEIQHTKIHTNGIDLHVASIGRGQPILFLHGFPELWYSWRHQMLALSSLGYRAIAPDLRGYGDSDAPPSAQSYTVLHIIGDLVGLLDALGIGQVLLVGHDWGAIIAWWFCLIRSERVKALVNLSVPFLRRHPVKKPVEIFRGLLGDDYYVCRFQQPEEAEGEFARAGTEKIIKKFFASRDPLPPVVPKAIGFGVSRKSQRPLPSWLSIEDLNYYVSEFDKSGFTGGLNYYRAWDLSWELTAPWHGQQVRVPVKFIVGDMDTVYHIPGMKEYIHGQGFKQDVPLLEEVVIMEGVAHYLNQEKPEEVSRHIYDFCKKFEVPLPRL